MKDRADGRVICAAQHCKMLNVQDLAVHKPFSGSRNSFRGTMNSLRGTNIVLRDTNVDSLRATKYFLRETRNSLRGTSIVFGVVNDPFLGKYEILPGRLERLFIMRHRAIHHFMVVIMLYM